MGFGVVTRKGVAAAYFGGAAAAEALAQDTSCRFHEMHLRRLEQRELLSAAAGVRARVANLLGNMCRHSGYFYPALDRHGILPPLIELCSDSDKGARWVHESLLACSYIGAVLVLLHGGQCGAQTASCRPSSNSAATQTRAQGGVWPGCGSCVAVALQPLSLAYSMPVTRCAWHAVGVGSQPCSE